MRFAARAEEPGYGAAESDGAERQCILALEPDSGPEGTPAPGKGQNG